jgi:hypothetical protein
MTLLFNDHTAFAHGAVKYAYRPATENDRTNRIIIPVEIESIQTYAVVDTGAPYVVCAPEIVLPLGLGVASRLSSTVLQIRGMEVRGDLYRLTLKLIAEQGESIDVEATVFVPGVNEWPANLPSFIGLNECMDRIRIAIDPAEEMFYFGSLN